MIELIISSRIYEKKKNTFFWWNIPYNSDLKLELYSIPSTRQTINQSYFYKWPTFRVRDQHRSSKEIPLKIPTTNPLQNKSLNQLLRDKFHHTPIGKCSTGIIKTAVQITVNVILLIATASSMDDDDDDATRNDRRRRQRWRRCQVNFFVKNKSVSVFDALCSCPSIPFEFPRFSFFFWATGRERSISSSVSVCSFFACSRWLGNTVCRCRSSFFIMQCCATFGPLWGNVGNEKYHSPLVPREKFLHSVG